jgi:hypothetical protein
LSRDGETCKKSHREGQIHGKKFLRSSRVHHKFEEENRRQEDEEAKRKWENVRDEAIEDGDRETSAQSAGETSEAEREMSEKAEKWHEGFDRNFFHEFNGETYVH